MSMAFKEVAVESTFFGRDGVEYVKTNQFTGRVLLGEDRFERGDERRFGDDEHVDLTY